MGAAPRPTTAPRVEIAHLDLRRARRRVDAGDERHAAILADDGAYLGVVAEPSQLALVTGAAGDIGRATARCLAEHGWELALVDHPSAADALDATRRECAALGAAVWTDTFDVVDHTAVARSVRSCGREIGLATAVFNNAGYQGQFVRIDRYPLDDAPVGSSRST